MAFAPGPSIDVLAYPEEETHRVRGDLANVLVTNLGPCTAYIGLGEGMPAELPILARTQVLLNKGVGCDALVVKTEEGQKAKLVVTVGTGQ